jgi:mannose-6-phosphate isomerase-like protein (cupin superfamily)
MAGDVRFTAAEAAALPFPPGRRSGLAFARGSMSLRHYAPRGGDPQTPHDQDELYVVIAGQGRFVCGGREVPFGPHDALFAPAGAEHRFLDFSPDFATWVVFYGPAGGEGG